MEKGMQSSMKTVKISTLQALRNHLQMCRELKGETQACISNLTHLTFQTSGKKLKINKTFTTAF